MKITFTKDCPAILPSGNSAYKSGDEADLPRGGQLVQLGYAREGWGAVAEEATPEPPKPTRKRKKK